MLGYEVETNVHRISGRDYQIRALKDRCQFWDPDGVAERAGICSTSWPLFGLVWPAGLALAAEMADYAILGKSILEIGCGIGISSLVLQFRGGDITSSDHHPLANEFLRHNAALNHLAPIRFADAPWSGPNPRLGRFDLIIGSDVLYEHSHVGLLAEFLAEHANPTAEIVLADPGRGHCARFGSRMALQGYSHGERRLRIGDESQALRGRMMRFARQSA